MPQNFWEQPSEAPDSKSKDPVKLTSSTGSLLMNCNLRLQLTSESGLKSQSSQLIQWMAERVGFEPTCRLITDNSISSRARYGLFATFPQAVFVLYMKSRPRASSFCGAFPFAVTSGASAQSGMVRRRAISSFSWAMSASRPLKRFSLRSSARKRTSSWRP